MKDYKTTTQAWWYKWHGNPINERLLSRFGVAVLDDNGALLAVSYIYPAQTAELAWIGFTVRDPYLSSYRAGKALMLLLQESEDTIRALGYPLVYVGYDASALKKLCERRQYHKGSAVQEYFKELI